MIFAKRPPNIVHSGVFLGGGELALVSDFRYVGVILDSTLSFRKHIKKVSNSVKYNLANFRRIRNSLTSSAALMFLHCMILSHIDYCLTSWSLACTTALKPIESLYKKALKTLHKKPFSFHICKTLTKYNFLSFENVKTFRFACFIDKSLHGLAPPPLNEFIKKMTLRGMSTRAPDRGDCEIPHRRTTYGRNVLSVVGGDIWNSLPSTIREGPTYSSFKGQLKQWLKSNQKCDHEMDWTLTEHYFLMHCYILSASGIFMIV